MHRKLHVQIVMSRCNSGEVLRVGELAVVSAY